MKSELLKHEDIQIQYEENKDFYKAGWNAAIQRCMDLLEANRKISDYDKENLSYAMRREKK